MQASEQIIKAIHNYLEGKATPQEKAMVQDWYYAFDDTEIEISSETKDLHRQIETRLRNRIHQSIHQKEKSKVQKLKPLWIAAASLFLIFSIGLYFSLKQKPIPPTTLAKKQIIEEIQPGGNNATLTLANGEKINLSNAKIGNLASQAGILITNKQEGQLVYEATSSKGNHSNMTNTIETPNGGQYQITLPDGTKVWLNAASSLKYPVQFATNERRVELSGEGYFEVSKDKSKPFKVVTIKQNIEVLGTHFNVNSYTDEQTIKTTLLEGSVKVNSLIRKTCILQPGQQSILGSNSLQIQLADLERTMAWKNGNFMFDGEDLNSIMRKISKWYNVKVTYQHQPAEVLFTGVVSRSKNLIAVIRALEATGKVHFKVEGNQITVL
ncbi:MAG: FecR family protein [Candidatus Pedobacter colombiensis]|uniref:FecR family protein n=1 Tax=Candidatus Pedobacter colombiensis TaxID=3121371 RepID=A0AAJ5W629_9SPHI|nr:FecR family protein [Pedobacter sp.]WEK18684.1 MAG: FecR family protein [Pedobacter sp.]